jgi:uncharacterized protein (TIGR02145 family)
MFKATANPGGLFGTGVVSPVNVTGLTNGTAYTFTVTATNINGTGPASGASNSVTPSTVPGAPTIGTATEGNAQATVTFTAPVSDGGSAITVYTVTSTPDGKTGTGSSSPVTVPGLTNGTAYTFKVTASNVNGTGLASLASNSVTPSTVPGVPTGVTATPGNAQAFVTFTPPVSNGGSVITGYTVTSSPSGFVGTGSASPIVVSGLVNGTAYTFTVSATNINGPGSPSIASNSVTPLTTLVLDADGNIYNTVTIGAQTWMKENLKTTKYNDGVEITYGIDAASWASASTGLYCDYNNNSANSTTYGRLYNWFAVDNNAATKVASNGGKNVCPSGWHIPSDAEWTILENFLITNGYNYDGTTTGNKIGKSLASSSGWTFSTTTGAVGNTDYSAKRDVSGFTALPGGFSIGGGGASGMGNLAVWWSSTQYLTADAWYRIINYQYTTLDRGNVNKLQGYSVRCLKD